MRSVQCFYIAVHHKIVINHFTLSLCLRRLSIVRVYYINLLDACHRLIMIEWTATTTPSPPAIFASLFVLIFGIFFLTVSSYHTLSRALCAFCFIRWHWYFCGGVITAIIVSNHRWARWMWDMRFHFSNFWYGNEGNQLFFLFNLTFEYFFSSVIHFSCFNFLRGVVPDAHQ